MASSIPLPKRSLEECHRIMTGPGAPWEYEEKVIKGRRVKTYKQLPGSVRDFWLATKPFANREYIVYEDERLTFGAADAKIRHLASLFHQRGVRKGDRVAIAMRNLPEWALSFFAAHMLGAVAVAVNAWLSPEAFAHCLELTQPRIVLVDEERAKLLQDRIAPLRRQGCKAFFVTRSSQQIGAGLEKLEDALRASPARDLPDVNISPEDPAIIFFTSGTMSMPKGVLSTQRQFLTNRLNTSSAQARAILRQGLDLPAPDPKAPPRSVLLTIPLFHVMGCHSFLMLLTALGGKIVLMRKFDPVKASHIIRREGITSMGGVPHMVMQLIEHLEPSGELKLDGFSFGGGPASTRLPSDVKKKLPEVSAAQGFGLTGRLLRFYGMSGALLTAHVMCAEVNSVATSFAGDDYILRPASCGLAAPNVDLKIIPPESKKPVSDSPSLAPNEIGEICIAGANVAEGYYNDEKATKEAFEADGWFKSGDLGYLDEDGFLYIADRAKDIVRRLRPLRFDLLNSLTRPFPAFAALPQIIRSGENISSVSVENAIFQHDAVKEVAVVPVPCEVRGEEIAAVIVLHPHSSSSSSRRAEPPTEHSVQALVASQLPKHCVPALVVFAEGELPRNATGKVLKGEVKKVAVSEWERRRANKAGRAKL
ncbi:SPOSA6832_00846, partial [Sporobolomyces salmonicolor]